MYVVMTIRDGAPDEIVGVEVSQSAADALFIEACLHRVPAWSDYSAADIQDVLDEGFCEYVCGGEKRCVAILDLSNTRTDKQIKEMLATNGYLIFNGGDQ